MKRALLALLALLALSACTPGAVTPSSGSSGGSGTTTITVNLTMNPPSQTPAGTGGGYAPVITTVAVGSSIRFTNTDGFAHTATLIQNAATFPSGSPFNASALNRSGSTISQAWTSGTLQAGTSSQSILVDQPGTYLFGCFFHYGSPMRGEIVAQ